jgi:Zn-dependent protease with chaperone function
MTIEISSEFKKQTIKAVAAIVLFVVFYILLLLSAMALTVGCLYAGFGLIIAKPMFFTLVLGLGLASLGVMIIVFLFKFLFKRNKTDLSNFMEVTRKEEPRLFEFIDEIVATTGTDFPKKVYLSTEVNASVFYDSGFWSMFLPIKKNLHIGMGLVNTITHDELKAILSHEFGHFSQKSMKVGSYVYNVNQIVYNLLYDNQAYYNNLAKWNSVSGYFALFTSIADKIIQGIQWLLQKMYGIVNRSYMALSREMEFHADEVAANVTGYLPLKTSLLRMDLADKGYNNVLNFYGGKIEHALVSKNIFKEQQFVMHFLAEKQGIPVVNQFPEVQMEHVVRFNSSKLVIKNQWASHPEIEDRIAALERLNIVKPNPNNEPANCIFMDAEQTQQVLTDQLFTKVSYTNTPTQQSFEGFKEAFHTFYQKETFHPAFKGYYDSHSPTDFKTVHPERPDATFDTLFTNETGSWTKEVVTLKEDLNLLEAIKNKTVDIANYDYEGVKYKAKDANQTILTLKESLLALEKKIQAHDQTIYKYFFHKAQDQFKLHEFREICDKYVAFDVIFDANFELRNTLVDKLAFTRVVTPHEVIRRDIANFRTHETTFKETLQTVVSQLKKLEDVSVELQSKVHSYISSSFNYFDGENYKEDQLETFFDMLYYFESFNQRIYFLQKKQWLDYCLEIEGVESV